MRKAILTSIVALMCLSATAQKIEIGLNGGMMLHSSSGKNFSNNATVMNQLKRDPIGSYGSAKASVILKNWQAGIGFEKYRTEIQYNKIRYNFDSDRSTLKSISPYVFGNRLFKLPKSYVYAGVNAGLCLGKAYTETDVQN